MKKYFILLLAIMLTSCSATKKIVEDVKLIDKTEVSTSSKVNNETQNDVVTNIDTTKVTNEIVVINESTIIKDTLGRITSETTKQTTKQTTNSNNGITNIKDNSNLKVNTKEKEKTKNDITAVAKTTNTLQTGISWKTIFAVSILSLIIIIPIFFYLKKKFKWFSKK